MTMDIQSLPQFRGLPDSLRAWGEPNDHGLLPTVRLRDYIVLCVLIATLVPMLVPLRSHSWDEQQRIEARDAAWRQQLQEDVLRDVRDPKRVPR